MTPDNAVFWIYLAAYYSVGGIAALVLGLIARYSARPFDSPRRLGVFLGLLLVVALVGVVASALSFSLAYDAGAPALLTVISLVWPWLIGEMIFFWASGFPLSRIVHRPR